ncbi:DNA cytosine methyltransferase [Rhizobium laguerreae]|uniref:DNA cytosine methyltransferase n=1 Tax=Rhizobium laguerreae TaxID=1076926 RepID=UPI001C90E945|nr:DNA cytosine methyltransferase [Rhizobium laguerreae]
MTAYYNEIDPYAAAWLRNLIAAGHIAPGDVDERSIVDVQPDDLRGYTQCHFFAGIGGWSYALHLAGWPDNRPVWTGSCPCQPFSVGSVAHGGAKGQGDERHLWPTFRDLISERSPATVFGEQVADAIGWGWWDEVALDLEEKSYACAAVVLPANAVGARHRRKRLFWMADASGEGRKGYQPLERLPVAAETAFSFDGNPLAGAGRALDGDYSDLLPCDGLSVAVERLAAKGYGNAIVPQAAAEVIGAYMEIAA